MFAGHNYSNGTMVRERAFEHFQIDYIPIDFQFILPMYILNFCHKLWQFVLGASQYASSIETSGRSVLLL